MIEVKFQNKMVSNKHIDFRKIKNFVRSKRYPEDIWKDKGKKANFRKSCKNFKFVDEHLTYKGRIKGIFDNDKQDHSILPLSNTHLRSLNCKQSKSFKYFNITILYPFCLKESLGSTYFPK